MFEDLSLSGNYNVIKNMTGELEKKYLNCIYKYMYAFQWDTSITKSTDWKNTIDVGTYGSSPFKP